ncbi:glycine betaine/L-proline ABC transporter substrate-binding protein ProX [Halomonas sp. C05BenzN]|uniref:glycine betaine/L-proline ABC transporter substrate-binding protein ProX n=1 Tax=Halomonas sp. C05BenzN TaxID=3411041 RepID=UPI003B93DEEF
MKYHARTLRPLKWAVLAAAAAWALTATENTAADQPGEGVSVQPAVATWTSAVPVSWAFVELLTELGYDVQTPISLSNPVAYLAITEGDADYWPNGWFPLHDPQLPDNFHDVATLFDPLCPACGIQGYLVDTPSVEAYDISGIDDFTRDEVKAAFDATGDGKADLFGCPPGWGCHEGINAMLDTFELRDHINHVDAGYAANFAEALSRIQSGEPALYYTWGPSAWLLSLVPGEDVMWINAPGIVEDEAERAEGVEGAVSDPVEMGFVAADIQVAANNAFLEANPAAAELFRQVRLPLEWISEVDGAMDEQDLTDDQVRPLVAEWIAANRDTVDEWLEAARGAAE